MAERCELAVTGMSCARRRSANMDTLIALGTLTAFAASRAGLVTGGGVYFDSAAVVMAFVALGRYREVGATARASGSIQALLELGAKDARVLVGGREQLVRAGRVTAGSLLRLRPREKIPVDGQLGFQRSRRSAVRTARDHHTLTAGPPAPAPEPATHLPGGPRAGA